MTDSSNIPKNTLTRRKVEKATMIRGPYGLGASD